MSSEMGSNVEGISTGQLYWEWKRIMMFDRYLLSRYWSSAVLDLHRVKRNRYCLEVCMTDHLWWRCSLPRSPTNFVFSFDNFSMIFC